MPFPDSKSADVRLVGDAAPLTEEEIRDLLPWVRVLSIPARERLQAELSLIQLGALKRQEQLATRQLQSFSDFDKSTARANRWMIGFTAAVAFMTLVMMFSGLYPLWRERSGTVASQNGEVKEATVSQTSSITNDGEGTPNPKTWGSAEASATCSKKEHGTEWFSTDGKQKQVVLSCTIKNLTSKIVPITAPPKMEALFRLPDGSVVRGHAYLGSNQREIPAGGQVQDAGLVLGNDDCPAKQSDDACVQAELMNASELLLTDTVSEVRFHVLIE